MAQYDPFQDPSVEAAAQESSYFDDAVSSAARDPRVRQAAISAARDPQVQAAAISVASRPEVQSAAISWATGRSSSSSQSQSQSQSRLPDNYGVRFPGEEEESGQPPRPAAPPPPPSSAPPPPSYPPTTYPEDDGRARGSSSSTTYPTEATPPPTSVPGALKLFTLFKVPVFLHWTFPIIIILDIANSFRFSNTFLWMALFILLDVVLFVSVLIHEYGHCFATRCLKGHAHYILLWPLGGLAYVGHSGGPKEEILIALAGPLTHIPQALMWAFIAVASSDNLDELGLFSLDIKHDWGRNFVLQACFQQIILFAFNLLVPAFPLDGGRILASSLIQHYNRVKTANIIMALSIPIGLGLVLYGAIVGYMLTAFVGAWILWQTFKIFRAKQSNTLHQHPLFLFDRGGVRTETEDPTLIPSNRVSV